jgi:aliphatic nitrilase
MYAQNEQVHIAAWPSFSLYRGGAYALGAEVNNAASRIYAVEGQCFVLAPCATVSAEMIEQLCGNDPTKRQLLLEGGGFTGIYAPDGQLISRPLPEGRRGSSMPSTGMIALARRQPTRPGTIRGRRDAAAARQDPGDRVVVRRRDATSALRDARPGGRARCAKPGRPSRRARGRRAVMGSFAHRRGAGVAAPLRHQALAPPASGDRA